MHITRLLFTLIPLFLAACSSTPDYASRGADGTLTPRNVAAAPEQASGHQVLWGGVALKTVNLRDRTQIEVLAYPLDGSERPQLDQPALGRFIYEEPGYLEPANYSNQRELTVVGTVSGVLPGAVGASDYDFPLVTNGQVTLWPRYQERGDVRSNIHFGIGVGSGGHWGGGVGVGF